MSKTSACIGLNRKIEWFLVGNPLRHEGVPRIHIFLLRLVYALMAIFVGQDAWGHILRHTGEWQPMEAMAWSVWAAFASLALLGMVHPLRMLPILLLEVFYKLLWLAVVAFPLWSAGQLVGSSAEGMTYVFAWVVLPIVAIPWPYVIRTFVLGRSNKR